MPDKLLLHRLADGDRRAFDTLVNDHKDLVFNVCYGYLRDHMEAEDLAQEVFIEVSRSVKGFRKDAKISTWLYRIAVNKCLDRIRYLKRDKRSGEHETPALYIEDPNPSPQDQLESNERKKVLWNALRKLPDKQHTVIVLASIEGLSYAEISAVMELTTGAIESLIFRAKKKLKALLEEHYESIR
ncbi:MAG: RNA polymerase sigma-70 factor (ECF subfamily) [Flavobacteriales bacterium]|jgi:RNA polymerase sigma-70 factor (ECF subfamily)